MFDIGLVEVGSDGVIDDARFCCQSHHENLSTMRFIIDASLSRFFQTEIVQGTSKKTLPRLGEIDCSSCDSFTYCRQEKATFSPHIHTTWEGYFRGPLYMAPFQIHICLAVSLYGAELKSGHQVVRIFQEKLRRKC